MMAPVEPIAPFAQHLEKALKDVPKVMSKPALEQLEAGKQISSEMTETVNALFDGAKGNTIQFETRGHDTIIKILDKDTGEIVRQIPPEELMEMKSKMAEITGQFIDTFV